MAVGSDWLRNEAVTYFFTTNAMGTRPTGWEVALIKDDGNEVASGDDANYARQSVSFLDNANVGRVENDASISFPAAETGASYTVAEFAIYDNNGNLLVQEALEFAKSIVGGDVISFAAGDLVAGVGV